MLVTGGGGFLGRYIVEQLQAEGHDVAVFCRGDYPDLRSRGVTIHRGDLRDTDAVAAACAGCSAVFHSAAVPGVWGKWDHYHSINTIGTRNVLAACMGHGVERLIYTSSPSVVFAGGDHRMADESLPYPDRWMCHYPHSKALAEQAVLAAADGKFRTISLRPHLIWGPRDNHLLPRLISKARSGRLRRVGDGRNVVSVAYVENAAAAHLQAECSLRNSEAANGKAYFINEPDEVVLWDWIDELLKRAGLPAVQGAVSLQVARRIGRVMEWAWTVLPLPGEPPMTRFVAAQLAGSHSYNCAAAVRDFGYAPPVSFDDAMGRVTPMLAELGKSA